MFKVIETTSILRRGEWKQLEEFVTIFKTRDEAIEYVTDCVASCTYFNDDGANFNARTADPNMRNVILSYVKKAFDERLPVNLNWYGKTVFTLEES